MEVKVKTTLVQLLENLKSRKALYNGSMYRVPALWHPVGATAGATAPAAEGAKTSSVNPYDFYIGHIEAILESARENGAENIPYKGTGGFWIEKAVVYNIFPRLAAAFDHNGDHVLGGASQDITVNDEGIRETGTLLKTIALLGHIHSLGCNVVYFLPTTAIGHDGNKGDLGSPYAIRNPYELDEKLADPLCDLDVGEQFKALVEACHLLGMKVILEFVFRTGAKDSDWIPQHPEWFYWIDRNIPERLSTMSHEEMKAAYGNPIFPDAELAEIKRKVEAHDLTELPPPPELYRKMFKLPPEGSGKVNKNDKGQFIGLSVDPYTGETGETRIPGAFADWPPDDVQPPWTDVTYLRLYNDEDAKHPRFNYIAYNTIRMYDTALARAELANRPLWDKIAGIIPHYQKSYGINGVMVDMGHALPPSLMKEIVGAARQNDPDFAFLSEDFTITEKSLQSGYNVVLGYAWHVEHERDKILQMLTHAGITGMPISFFATSESHNTPRSAARHGGVKFSRSVYLVNCFVPRGIPFIHNGFELGETHPVNTGLDFTAGDIESFRGKTLALFDRQSFDWERAEQFSRYISRCNELRNTYRDIVTDNRRESFSLVKTGSDAILAYRRKGMYEGRETELLVIVNMDFESSQPFSISLERAAGDKLVNQIDGKTFAVQQGVCAGELAPGEGALLVIS
ncbi:MAG: alpha-amylase [Candidatus Xenobiia bacterium LiM19]